jgi:Transposase DDE domain
VAVDAKGIPLGIVTAPANRHDTSLLPDTLNTVLESGLLSEGASVRLDRRYDSQATRRKVWARGLLAEISEKGKAAPVVATGRWIVERTNSWHNAHKKLVWCTERSARVVEFWIAFSSVLIISEKTRSGTWVREVVASAFAGCEYTDR